MKTIKIKATIQVGDTEIKVSGEFARLGMTKAMQHEQLARLIARAVKMAEAG